MIPERIVEFLSGPCFMQVGTRNAELRPFHAHVSAAKVGDDHETITFFVTEKRSRTILENVADNGRVAFTAAQPSHEAYQLKGTYLSSRPATDDELAVVVGHRSKLWAAVAQLWPEEFAKPLVLTMAYRPSVAITFRVEDIFVQTPGPVAGSRLG